MIFESHSLTRDEIRARLRRFETFRSRLHHQDPKASTTLPTGSLSAEDHGRKVYSKMLEGK